jgi:hypothetical protein
VKFLAWSLRKLEKRQKGKQFGKCYHYDKSRHWKSDYTKFLTSIGQGNESSLLVETCLVANSANSWCVV